MWKDEGEGWTNKQTLFPSCTMSTFEIPTGPAITQCSLAYNVCREETHCTKHQMTSLPWGSLTYDHEKLGHTLEWPNEEKFQI
jgi:hypothetical protein